MTQLLDDIPIHNRPFCKDKQGYCRADGGCLSCAADAGEACFSFFRQRAVEAAMKHLGVHDRQPDCGRGCLHPRRGARRK